MTEAKVARSGELLILRQSDFDARLPERDVLNALRAAFASLANGYGRSAAPSRRA